MAFWDRVKEGIGWDRDDDDRERWERGGGRWTARDRDYDRGYDRGYGTDYGRSMGAGPDYDRDRGIATAGAAATSGIGIATAGNLVSGLSRNGERPERGS